jgi:putative ABC transport system permease protein
MILRILKKDLKNKLAVNIILFLFILLATVFVSSSVNNIMVVTNATDYCMDMGKVGDVYVSTYEPEGQRRIDTWLKGEGSNLISDFSKDEAIILSSVNFKSFDGKDGGDFEIKNTIMLQTQWKENMVVYDMDKKLLSLNDGEIALQQK